MLFNEKLKMLRKEKNLTQEELAEKLNVSRQAITKWESGDGTPDIENLKQVSVLFNTSIDELVKEEKKITTKIEEKYTYIEELEIEHTKHFDIHISKIYELNIIPNDEVVVVRDDTVVGVGKAIMTGREMEECKNGIGVKIKHRLK